MDGRVRDGKRRTDGRVMWSRRWCVSHSWNMNIKLFQEMASASILSICLSVRSAAKDWVRCIDIGPYEIARGYIFSHGVQHRNTRVGKTIHSKLISQLAFIQKCHSKVPFKSAIRKSPKPTLIYDWLTYLVSLFSFPGTTFSKLH